MKVTVVKIQDGKPAGKRNTPTKIFIYNDGTEEKSLLLFEPKMVAGLNPGDLVELETEQNGKYVNAKSITFLSKGSVPPTTSFSTPNKFLEDPKKQESISRAVALDKALTLVVATGGKLTTDKAVDEVLRVSEIFFPYLMGLEPPTTNSDLPDVP